MKKDADTEQYTNRHRRQALAPTKGRKYLIHCVRSDKRRIPHSNVFGVKNARRYVASELLQQYVWGTRYAANFAVFRRIMVDTYYEGMQGRRGEENTYTRKRRQMTI